VRGFVARTAGAGGLLHLGLGPAQAGADLVGHDLDLGALVALLGVPGALLEPAHDDDAGALVERTGGVLAERAPRHDVEERRLLLPLTIGLVAPVDGQSEARDAAPTRGVAQLWITGHVAHEGDGVVCHEVSSLLRTVLEAGVCRRAGVRQPHPSCRGGLPR
jgi:hypothetical protein